MHIERHGMLLVLRDDRDRLMDFNTFFWETGLFIVSRKTGKSRIWLVSSEDTWQNKGAPPFNDTETKKRIAVLWELLTEQFSFVEKSSQDLSYCVSPGTLISNNFNEGIKNVHTWRSPDPVNLIAVWPQRLSLAPHWAEEVRVRLDGLGCKPQCKASPTEAPYVDTAPPIWESDWINYEQFCDRHLS